MSGNLAMKQGLTGEQLSMIDSEMNSKGKNKTLLYVLWFFTGGLGGHRYYLGDIGMGVAMTLTLGGLGLWALIDVFFIGKRFDEKQNDLERHVINEVKAYSK